MKPVIIIAIAFVLFVIIGVVMIDSVVETKVNQKLNEEKMRENEKIGAKWCAEYFFLKAEGKGLIDYPMYAGECYGHYEKWSSLLSQEHRTYGDKIIQMNQDVEKNWNSKPQTVDEYADNPNCQAVKNGIIDGWKVKDLWLD